MLITGRSVLNPGWGLYAAGTDLISFHRCEFQDVVLIFRAKRMRSLV